MEDFLAAITSRKRKREGKDTANDQDDILTGRCIPDTVAGTVLAGTGTVLAFRPAVRPVRNPSPRVRATN